MEKRLQEMTPDKMREILADISDVLWPDGIIDGDWDSDTLDDVSMVLVNAGLAPSFDGEGCSVCATLHRGACGVQSC